jgi:hypothetical protein
MIEINNLGVQSAGTVVGVNATIIWFLQ